MNEKKIQMVEPGEGGMGEEFLKNFHDTFDRIGHAFVGSITLKGTQAGITIVFDKKTKRALPAICEIEADEQGMKFTPLAVILTAEETFNLVTPGDDEFESLCNGEGDDEPNQN